MTTQTREQPNTHGSGVANGGFERIVEFSPAFDKRSPDRSKNYGIHGVDLRMVLKGEEGAVQFVLFTGWMLPHVEAEFNHKAAIGTWNRDIDRPNPADLGYHSKVPMYEGQSSMERKCKYTGGECFYDGSGLNAERIYEILVREGSDGVWKALEDYYVQTFKKSATP